MKRFLQSSALLALALILFAVPPARAATIYDIGIGNAGNDGRGMTLRQAFDTANTNFDNLNSAILGIVAGSVLATNLNATNATQFGIFYRNNAGVVEFLGIEQGTNISIYRKSSNIVINATSSGSGGGSVETQYYFDPTQIYTNASGIVGIKEGSFLTNSIQRGITTNAGSGYRLRGVNDPFIEITSLVLPNTLYLTSQGIGTRSSSPQPEVIFYPGEVSTFKIAGDSISPASGSIPVGVGTVGLPFLNAYFTHWVSASNIFLGPAVKLLQGNASPEGIISANPQSLWFQTNQTSGIGVWIKTNGTGSSGWWLLAPGSGGGGGLSDGDKGDVTVSGSGSSWTVDADAISYSKIQNISATQRVLGRNTAGAGDVEEVTLSQLLDWVGSAAQGDILYRGVAGWSPLHAGTSGQLLQTPGPGGNPLWATVGTLTDTDKGDITVSGSGTVFTIDNGTINSPRIQKGIMGTNWSTYGGFTNRGNYVMIEDPASPNVPQLELRGDPLVGGGFIGSWGTDLSWGFYNRNLTMNSNGNYFAWANTPYGDAGQSSQPFNNTYSTNFFAKKSITLAGITPSRLLMGNAGGTATNVATADPANDFAHPDGTTGPLITYAAIPTSGIVGGSQRGWSTNLSANLLLSPENLFTNWHYRIDVHTLGFVCTVSNGAGIYWRGYGLGGVTQLPTNGTSTIEIWKDGVSLRTNAILHAPGLTIAPDGNCIQFLTNLLTRVVIVTNTCTGSVITNWGLTNSTFIGLVGNGGTAVKTITAGANMVITDRGTNLLFDASATASGTNFPGIIVTNRLQFLTQTVTPASDTNAIIDLAKGANVLLILTTNAHIVFSNAVDGILGNLLIKQDTNGARSILSARVDGGSMLSTTNDSGSPFSRYTTNANAMDRWVFGTHQSTNVWVIQPASYSDVIVATTGSLTLAGSITLSGSVTATNGFRQPAGAGTSNAWAIGMVHLDSASRTNHSTTGSYTNLSTFTVPAHTLTNNGDTVIASWSGVMLAGTNKFFLGYGSITNVLDVSGLTNGHGLSGWKASMRITRTGNTGQRILAEMQFNPGFGIPYSYTNQPIDIAETNGIDNLLRLQGSAIRAGGITNNFFDLEFRPAIR